MRQSNLDKARYQAKTERYKRQGKVVTDLEGLIGIILGGNPLPTQTRFVLSHERIKWYVGPVGCAKTSSLVASVLVPAMLYPGSRWFIGRSTWWTLEQTTLQRFYECLDRLGPNAIVDKVVGPPTRIWVAPARSDEKGNAMEPSELVFHGLDNFEKLGSTEFSGVAIDEANETTENIVVTLNTRLRHRRPGQLRAEGPYFLNLASNPVNRSHFLHKKFCNEQDCDPTPWGAKFKPLPEENVQNLPPGYYEQISEGMSAEMRIRLIDGECGPDPSGQAVFPEFRPPIHVTDLQYVPNCMMIRGWDFGRRRPACVWAQITPEGYVNRLACVLGDNEPLEMFAGRVLQRSQMQFPHASGWRDFVDPHGNQRRDVTDLTSIDVLQRMGIRPQWRDVNVEMGLSFMSKGLCTLINGRPKSMYDRTNCGPLIEGYSGGYVYQTPRPGHPLKEGPMKDGYYEHLMDADRYIEVNLNLGSSTPVDQHRRILRQIRNPVTGY